MDINVYVTVLSEKDPVLGDAIMSKLPGSLLTPRRAPRAKSIADGSSFLHVQPLTHSFHKSLL